MKWNGASRSGVTIFLIKLYLLLKQNKKKKTPFPGAFNYEILCLIILLLFVSFSTIVTLSLVLWIFFFLKITLSCAINAPRAKSRFCLFRCPVAFLIHRWRERTKKKICRLTFLNFWLFGMMKLTLRLNTFLSSNLKKKKNVVVVDRTIIEWLHPFDILLKKSP